MPGIDALRAIAVMAVFLYHAGVGWMPGGFLGVDVFFVISGYLITSLLLAEYRRGGHIRLGPLLGAPGAAPAAGGRRADRGDDGRRGDRRARPPRPSCAATRSPPSPTSPTGTSSSATSPTSTSSSAPRCSATSGRSRSRSSSTSSGRWSSPAGMTLFGRRRLIVGVLAGALASVALAWALFDPHDASRAYYGTDTHAVGLLVGVALALVWSPATCAGTAPAAGSGLCSTCRGARRSATSSSASSRSTTTTWPSSTAATSGWRCSPRSSSPPSPTRRRASAACSAQRPLVWLGLRSYSFYLWHWPVLALTRPGVDVSMPRGILIPLQLAGGARPRRALLPLRRDPLPAPAGARRTRHGLAPLRTPGAAGRRAGGRLRGRLERHLRRAAGETWRQSATAASTAESRRQVEPAKRPARGSRLARKPPCRIVAFGDSVMIGAKERLAARLGRRFSMNAR